MQSLIVTSVSGARGETPSSGVHGVGEGDGEAGARESEAEADANAEAEAIAESEGEAESAAIPGTPEEALDEPFAAWPESGPSTSPATTTTTSTPAPAPAAILWVWLGSAAQRIPARDAAQRVPIFDAWKRAFARLAVSRQRAVNASMRNLNPPTRNPFTTRCPDVCSIMVAGKSPRRHIRTHPSVPSGHVV
jgi:hypothetical protein